MADAGGIASTRDLHRWGLDDVTIRLLVGYGRSLIRVRRGWYALPGTSQAVRDACRWGGRLACASALLHHGVRADEGGRLHVELPANAVIRREAGDLGTVRLHWARRGSPGDRAAVDVNAAHRQLLACRTCPPL